MKPKQLTFHFVDAHQPTLFPANTLLLRPYDERAAIQIHSECDLAVLASISEAGKPQGALVGIAVTQGLELIFDTVNSSRKYRNLIRNPSVAFVIGWTGEITIQYEGEAEEPTGRDLARYKEIYFQKWPVCREHEKRPGIAYFKVRPKWIRYSDFNEGSRRILEREF